MNPPSPEETVAAIAEKLTAAFPGTDARWWARVVAKAGILDVLKEHDAAKDKRIAELEEAGAEYIRRTDPALSCGPPDDPSAGKCGTCRCCLLDSLAATAEVVKLLAEPAARSEDKTQHHCGVSGWNPMAGDPACPACAEDKARGGGR